MTVEVVLFPQIEKRRLIRLIPDDVADHKTDNQQQFAHIHESVIEAEWGKSIDDHILA